MESLLIVYILTIFSISVIYRKKLTSINEYAIGAKNHSTLIIVAAILGSTIGGPMLLTRSKFAFDMNLTYILASFGSVFSIVFYYYFSPFLYKKYNQKISAGEIIEAGYGIAPRRITGICSVMLSIIFIGAQIKVFGLLFSYTFGIKVIYGLSICVAFVMSYSIFGGARIISANIIFKFYILLIIIPLFSGSTIEKFGGLSDFITHSSIKTGNFDLHKINIQSFLSMFFIFAIPYFNPPFISITLMGKNKNQSSSAFLISSIILVPLLCIFTLIGLTAYAINPDIAPQISFFYVADHTNSDYKSLLIVGVLAIITSTIDCYLNTGSISLVHDFFKTLYPEIKGKFELLLIKLASLFIMIMALMIAILFSDIYELVSYSTLVWGSTITIPLLFAILANPKMINFYIPLTLSIGIVSIWIVFQLEEKTQINPIIPAVIFSFIGCLFSIIQRQFFHNWKSHSK